MRLNLLFQDIHRVFKLIAVNGEREIRQAIVPDILNNHVDINIGISDRPKDLICNARMVWHAQNCNFCLITIECNT